MISAVVEASPLSPLIGLVLYLSVIAELAVWSSNHIATLELLPSSDIGYPAS